MADGEVGLAQRARHNSTLRFHGATLKAHSVKLAIYLCVALLLAGCSGGHRRTLTIAIDGASATIAPNGTFSLTASVANDNSGDGVTWTLNGGGALSATTTTSTTYTAPATVPATPNVTITATSIADTSVSQSVTFTITQSVSTTACGPSPVARGSEAALGETSVAFLVKGDDSADEPIAYAGSVTFNGDGTIGKAGMDVVGYETGETGQQTIDLESSSYSYGSDGRGCLYLSFNPVATRAQHPAGARKIYSRKARFTISTGRSTVKKAGKTRRISAAAGDTGAVVFSFSLLNLSGPGRIEEFDNTTGSGTVAAGQMNVQTSDDWQAGSLAHSFAFGADGWSVIDESGDLGRLAVAGQFQLGEGILSNGTADENVEGSVNFGAGALPGPLTGGSGTYSSTVDGTTGRGSGSYASSSQDTSYDFAFYIINDSDAYVISTDDPTDSGFMISGRWLQAAGTGSSVNLGGYYLNSLNGIDCGDCGDGEGDNGNNYVSIATLFANGTAASGTIDINDAGSFSSGGYSGSFSFDPGAGRVLFADGVLSGQVGYVTNTASEDQIAAFTVGTDDNAGAGYIFTQSNTQPNYNNGSLSGNFVFGTAEDVAGDSGSEVGLFSFDGDGNYNATVDEIFVGSAYAPDGAASGQYSVDADGTGSFDDGVVYFVTNGTLTLGVDANDADQPFLYFFIGQPAAAAGKNVKATSKATSASGPAKSAFARPKSN